MDILILDDDSMELSLLEHLVEQLDFSFDQIHCATSVLDAKKIVEQGHVGIALCDIEMPVEGGMDFARWMAEQGQKIGVIFVTSHARFDYAAQAIRLHARGYILKPVMRADLDENIRSCLEYLDQSGFQDVAEEENSLVVKTKQYIQTHLDENIARADLARNVYLHPDYLSSIFREKTGMTLTDYITGERIRLAEKLLRETQKSISEIALDVGFTNTSYFIKIFKKLTGDTPKKYREL